jgi:pyruvate dehydrogenase E2 component (dihydrolipoamide acetyltransferase)
MSFSVVMPALGESVTEGTVTRWLKKEGEFIAIDEPLLEVSTDKVDTEIPSPVAGRIERIVVAIDETVPVGAQLAVIATTVASVPTPEPSPVPAPEPSPVPAPGPSPVPAPGPSPVPVPGPSPVPVPVPEPVVTPATSDTGAMSEEYVITMPALGESVTEGTVTRWLKSVGDSVAVDEPLLEISTDKVDTEIPSPVAGTLISISVQIDETVPVGAKLAIVGSANASATQTPAPAVAPAVAPAPAPVAAPALVAAAAPVPELAPVVVPRVAAAPAAEISDAYITPLVRKLATTNKVDLSGLKGTGIGGRIRKQDVLDAAERAKAQAAALAAASAQAAQAAQAPAAAVAAPSATTPSTTVKASSELRGSTVTMTRLRKVIAARMVESLQTSAQLTTVVEVDVTKIARLRDRAKKSFESREGVKLSYMPFFAVAVCEALKQHSNVNASLQGDQITYHAAEHLGIAVDTERGLLVPVIRDAGDLNIGGIARKIADVASRTRDNKVSPDELSGGTFTITNTGSRGALFDTPIINQPQVAILGTGAVVKRPIVVADTEGGETIAIRSMIYLALSYDHRIVDGADAARFLSTLKERLEEGRFESDLGLS